MLFQLRIDKYFLKLPTLTKDFCQQGIPEYQSPEWVGQLKRRLSKNLEEELELPWHNLES